MSKTTTPATALILSLLAASWVCLGCQPLDYEDSYLNEHEAPALVEILVGEEDDEEHARFLLVLGPGQSDSLTFSEFERIHARSARDLQGRPLRLVGGRIQGVQDKFEAEVWSGLPRLRIGMKEAEVREILPSLTPLSLGRAPGTHGTVGMLSVTFAGEGLSGWCLYERAKSNP